MGQVIFWDHEVSVSKVLFPSFAALLSTYAEQLEADLYLGFSPLIELERLTHLSERRMAFLSPSPAKPMLHQALKRVWESEDIDDDPTYFHQVLHMEEATPEDRFLAYYGLISLYETETSYPDDFTPSLFARLEAEASAMPQTHWIHEEVALLKPWSIR